tara:strand:- start:850 stop:1479 length:630 start_codon:yes stop_codon:yes gene_type:complete
MESQLIIDDHLQRSAVDAMRLSSDITITNQGAALVGLLVHGFHGGRPSHIQIAKGMEQFRPAIEFCEQVFRPRVRIITQAAVQAVIARAYYSVNTDLLKLYVKSLLTGVQSQLLTSNQHNAALLLRNFLLISCGSSRRRARRTDIYERTQRSLFAFLNNEPIKKLYPARKELFPLDDSDADAIYLERKKLELGRRTRKPLSSVVEQEEA